MISIACKAIFMCLFVALALGQDTSPPDYVYPVGTCTATATITPRPSTGWTDNNTFYQVYDISLLNTGTCRIDVAQLYFPDETHATQTWNYHIGGIWGLADVITFPQGFVFGPGDTFSGAGFILPQPYTPAGAIVIGNCNCLPEDQDPTVAPSAAPSSGPVSTPSAAPSSAPSLAPSAAPSSAPSSAPSAAPTVASDFCSRTRLDVFTDASWQSDDGIPHQIVDLSITNEGSIAISSFQIEIVTDATVSSDIWNIELGSGNTYNVLLYGNPLLPQARLDNIGFELIGHWTSITCNVVQVTC